MKLAIVNPIQRRFSGGYAKYLGEIVPRLAADPRVSALSVWLPAEAECGTLDPTTIQRWPGGMTRRGLRALRGRIASSAPDVVFVPTARHIGFGAIPTVVMVRNMEPLKVPVKGNDAGEALRNLARAAAARRACARAERVIAVSQHVRDFLRGHWRIPDQRIGVVYHGVTPAAETAASVCPAALAGSEGSFVFTAGSLRAARGIEDVLAAMPALLRGDPAVTLVIAGTWDPGSVRYRRRITALVEALQVGGRIVWAGQLGAAEMMWCFQHADVFVMTSRAEACPNIALEALSHGCAIASTSDAPMPEFLGDAALYYPAKSADPLAETVRALRTETPGERTARRERAVARSRTFDWAATVDGTIEQLQLAARRPADASAGPM